MVIEREKIVEFETVIREINQVVLKETHEVTIEKSRIYEVPVEVELVASQKAQEKEQEEADVGQVEGSPSA